jgi:lipoic acid synthetase
MSDSLDPTSARPVAPAAGRPAVVAPAAAAALAHPMLPQSIAMGGGTFEAALDGSVAPRRHPDWIKARIPSGETYQEMRRLLHGLTLHTVCEEAHCPNMGECWDQKTATVMILGDTCTRACGFCAIKTGKPTIHDLDEPRRVAEALSGLGLDHVVVTSVARDDLADGGASVFADTIRRLRAACPGMGVEVLIPDFNGEAEPLRTVMAAGPDILNHNVETVARLQKPVRKRARYERSLGVLARAKEYARELSPSSTAEKPAVHAVHTKSSIMVGLGETRPELHQTFLDLRAVDCDILTLGQYLRPSPAHLPVERYYHPDEFAEMREEALALGFKHVESGPLVRSSYHARDQVPDAEARRAARSAGVAVVAASSGVAPAAGVAPAGAPAAGSSGVAPARAAGVALAPVGPSIDADGRVIYRAR